MKDFKLPEWTRDLPDSTLLNSKDMGEIFQLSPKFSIRAEINRGLVPESTSRIVKENRYKTSTMWWELGYLRVLEQLQF